MFARFKLKLNVMARLMAILTRVIAPIKYGVIHHIPSLFFRFSFIGMPGSEANYKAFLNPPKNELN